MPFATRTPVLTLRDSTTVPEVSRNQYGYASPRDQVVTTLADGRIVVVWSGTIYGDNDVRFQILNAAGASVTAPASVFGVEDPVARAVSVTALADGGFLIRGDGQLQRYTATGTPSGPPIVVPSGSGGEIVAIGQGFAVATGSGGSGPTFAINVDFYGADNRLLSQQVVSTTTGSRGVSDIQMAIRPGGDPTSTRIAVVWSELPIVGYPAYQGVEVKVQVVDGNGRAIGSTIQLGTKYELIKAEPDVAFLADGSFVVAWSSGYESRGAGAFLTYRYTQHFSSEGVALNAATEVGAASNSFSSSVTALADGGYLITWNVNGIGYAQQYDAQSNKVGAELTFGLPANGAVALADGSVLVIGGLQFAILSPNINVETGNNANNVYEGTAGDDTYSGVTGNDTIYGSGGNDLLRGDEGNDFLYGGAGNDILVGGVGFDTIDGGEGYDVLQLDKSLASYFVEETATGFRLWDGAEYDTVTNVEGVYSADGRVYSLADFDKLSFNALAYIAGYADLANGFGANASAGYQHYIANGKAEGRTVKFNPVSYLAANADLAAGFGYDPDAAARHFIEHGRFEGRKTAGFDALLYAASNPDLARIYGVATDALTLHYLQFGAREGRPLTGFDALEYSASNVDVARAYNTNVAALIYHYLTSGADEGRALNTFDPLVYAASHSDLARYFGSDANGAIRHYINNGISEGRAAGGFDSIAYLLSNSDLAGIGPRGALLHWLNNGADEGRIGDDLFGREQGTAHGLANAAAQASLEKVGDHDWFEIGFVAGYDAVIRLSGATSGGGTLTDGWLQLFNEAGVLVASNRGAAGTSDAEITFRPTATGRYFLVVAGETDQQTGTYRVTVNGVPAAVASSASLAVEHDAFIALPATKTVAVDPFDDWAQEISATTAARSSGIIPSDHPDIMLSLLDDHSGADHPLWIKAHSDGIWFE